MSLLWLRSVDVQIFFHFGGFMYGLLHMRPDAVLEGINTNITNAVFGSDGVVLICFCFFVFFVFW